MRLLALLSFPLFALALCVGSCVSSKSAPPAAPSETRESAADPLVPEGVPGSNREITLLVDNPTGYPVYFDGNQRVGERSSGSVKLLIEDAALTSGFDILYEIPLSDTVSLFCKGDHRIFREAHRTFTVIDPSLSETYGTFVVIRNIADNAVSFYTGGEANPAWEQRGDPLMGDNLSRTDKREFSPGETAVFRIDRDAPSDSYRIRDRRNALPLPLPDTIQANYCYTFDYSPNGAVLVDARPLRRMGEPSWTAEIPDVQGAVTLADIDGMVHLFAPTAKGVTRHSYASSGAIGEARIYGAPFEITFAAQWGEGFFLTGYESDGSNYTPVARVHREDGGISRGIGRSSKPEYQRSYVAGAAKGDGNRLLLVGGASGSIKMSGNDFSAYACLVRDTGDELMIEWEIGSPDFERAAPGVLYGPIGAVAYDAVRSLWFIAGDVLIDGGSYIAAIDGDGTILKINIDFQDMKFNALTSNAAGFCYAAGEVTRDGETYGTILKLDSDCGQIWRIPDAPPGNSYYQDAFFDGKRNQLALTGTMRANDETGSGGVPFIEGRNPDNGALLWREELKDPRLAGTALAGAIAPAPDYGFMVALSGITEGYYGKPCIIARVNERGKLY